MRSLLSNLVDLNMADELLNEKLHLQQKTMAHLLGSKACIDSLRVDIDDLQSVAYEIVGKTGSIK